MSSCSKENVDEGPKEPTKIAVTFEAGENGTVNLSGTKSGNAGDTIFSVASGNGIFYLKGWYNQADPQTPLVDSKDITISGDTLKVKLTDATKDNVFKAQFTDKKYTVTFNVDGAGAGTVTKSSGSGTPGSVLSSNIETVTVGYKFLGWYDGGAEITETSTDADVYLSDRNRQLNVKVSGDKTYTATFEKVNVDVPSEEEGKCAPRIYVAGTGDDVRLMLTKKPTNNGVFFQFGSIVAWDNKDGITAANIQFNPSNLDIPSWNSSWTVGDTFPEHVVGNLKAGKGDPCRLVGFSQKYIKEELESGRTPDNGKWFMPTNDQNKDFSKVGNRSNWTVLEGINGYYFGSGATPTGTDGEFMPAAGTRKGHTGEFAYLGTYGYYESNSLKTSIAAYCLHFTKDGVPLDSGISQSYGTSVRCVPQQ
ncbi:MAG: InlB B-repeat-containing protein [Phocaeicola sp.]